MYTFAYLGMQQIVIILVIALLIFGPQKVPELGRQIGGALRDLKKMSNDVQSAFDLDDHSSYDRYEPPTYEYTPPVSTTYGHEALDQYGLPVTSEHPAIEGTETVAEGAEAVETAVTEATSSVASEHSLVVAEAEATPLSLTDTVVSQDTMVTPTVAEPVLETETTTTVTSADAEAKGA